MTSRIARQPIDIPEKVKVAIEGQLVSVEGGKSKLDLVVHESVNVLKEDEQLHIKANDESANAMAGTMRSLIYNMVYGVSTGYEKRLLLVGVGYRAQLKGRSLHLSLGFSHPVDFLIEEGITIELPNQTEIVIKGVDKQRVGQVAANIRRLRPPEYYKGKGVRYADEEIKLKETKKK